MAVLFINGKSPADLSGATRVGGRGFRDFKRGDLGSGKINERHLAYGSGAWRRQGGTLENTFDRVFWVMIQMGLVFGGVSHDQNVYGFS